MPQILPGTWRVKFTYMRHGPTPIEGECPADTDGSVFFGEFEVEDLETLEHAHDLLEMAMPEDTVWMQIMSAYADFQPSEDLEEVPS